MQGTSCSAAREGSSPCLSMCVRNDAAERLVSPANLVGVGVRFRFRGRGRVRFRVRVGVRVRLGVRVRVRIRVRVGAANRCSSATDAPLTST